MDPSKSGDRSSKNVRRMGNSEEKLTFVPSFGEDRPKFWRRSSTFSRNQPGVAGRFVSSVSGDNRGFMVFSALLVKNAQIGA